MEMWTWRCVDVEIWRYEVVEMWRFGVIDAAKLCFWLVEGWDTRQKKSQSML